MYYENSNTATGDALRRMVSGVFTRSGGMRDDKSVPKVMSIDDLLDLFFYGIVKKQRRIQNPVKNLR